MIHSCARAAAYRSGATGLLEAWINKRLNYRLKTEIIRADEMVVNLRTPGKRAADSFQIILKIPTSILHCLKFYLTFEIAPFSLRILLFRFSTYLTSIKLMYKKVQ